MPTKSDGDEDLTKMLDRLMARIDNREVLHRVDVTVTRMEGEQRASNARLEGVAKIIYGNGVPGLKTDVDRLMQEAIGRRWERRRTECP